MKLEFDFEFKLKCIEAPKHKNDIIKMLNVDFGLFCAAYFITLVYKSNSVKCTNTELGGYVYILNFS